MRGRSRLNRLYVCDLEYSGIKVVKSAATSDHVAIVAFTGVVKNTVGETRRVRTFRKHTAAQNAHFLANVCYPVHIVNLNGDPQEEYNKLYRVMAELLDTYYPERTVTITSADPLYCTPAIKYMLRRKNQLMQSGRVEKAGALALKIARPSRTSTAPK
jgi:hypothetical protein